MLAAGGSKGEVAVWDTEENETLAAHFTPFLDKSCVAESEFVADDEDLSEENSDDEEEKKQVRKDKSAAKKQQKQKAEAKVKSIKQLNKISEGI